MRIKDLEKAEDLPVKASMRKSSDYDSWEVYHPTRHASWFDGFMNKHVGEHIDDVYSVFKKSLAARHVRRKTYDELVDRFKLRYSFYVDGDGILRKSHRKPKSRDKAVNYGEPATVYLFNSEHVEKTFPYIVRCFGYMRACSMVGDGITEKEYRAVTNEVRRLNNLLNEDGIKPYRYSWYCLTWPDLWVGHVKYPFTLTLKYRSAEYYRHWYGQRDAYRKRDRELKAYKVSQFNRYEVEHSERPFLI